MEGGEKYHSVFTVWADFHHTLDPEYFTIPRRSHILPRSHFSFPSPSPKAASSWPSVSINCACSGCVYQPQCVAFCIWFLSVGTALMKLFCIVAGTSLVFRTEHIISHCYGGTCHRQMLKIVRQEDHEFKINLRSTLTEQIRRHRHISYYRNAPTFFSLSTDEMVDVMSPDLALGLQSLCIYCYRKLFGLVGWFCFSLGFGLTGESLLIKLSLFWEWSHCVAHTDLQFLSTVNILYSALTSWWVSSPLQPQPQGIKQKVLSLFFKTGSMQPRLALTLCNLLRTWKYHEEVAWLIENLPTMDKTLVRSLDRYKVRCYGACLQS